MKNLINLVLFSKDQSFWEHTFLARLWHLKNGWPLLDNKSVTKLDSHYAWKKSLPLTNLFNSVKLFLRNHPYIVSAYITSFYEVQAPYMYYVPPKGVYGWGSWHLGNSANTDWFVKQSRHACALPKPLKQTNKQTNVSLWFWWVGSETDNFCWLGGWFRGSKKSK